MSFDNPFRNPFGSNSLPTPSAFTQPEYVNSRGVPVQLIFHSGANRWVWMCGLCKANMISPSFNITKTDDVTTCPECTAFKPTAAAQQSYWEAQKEILMLPDGPEQHCKLQGAPLDTVSELTLAKFSSDSDLMVAGSWDKSLRVWSISSSMLSYEPPASIKHKALARHYHVAPILGVAAAPESGVTKRCFFGSAAKVVCEYDLEKGVETVVGNHSAPVKDIKCLFHLGSLVASAGWDGLVKCWDLRMDNQSPAHTIDFGDRIWSMDATGPLHSNPLIGLVGPKEEVMLYDLRAARSTLKTTPLKLQKRCIRFFHDARGVLVGSAEGRCSVVHVSEADSKSDFSYKCHRTGHSVYAINALAIHPLGTFATVGSDGSFHTWDKDNRVRLKHFTAFPHQSITSASFSSTGNMLAYSTGYDWHEGIHGFKNEPVNIYVGIMKDPEIQPKAPRR